jgi:large subunit ribosomal protein L10
MPKLEKIEAVAEMKKLFESASSLFVTDYQGLDVADMTSLRKDLRDNKVKYLVAKNTLLKLAAQEAGLESLTEHFIGPTAVAFTDDDPAVAAKVLYESFKKKELPVTKVFIVDNELHTAADMKRLADLPPKDVLLAQVVSAVESPLTSLVGSIDGFFRELVGSLDALADKKKSDG